MVGFYFKVYDRLPSALRMRINPLEEAVRRFVLQAADKGPEALIVDAGAGQVPFSQLFSENRYVALDFGRGDPDWDYSRLDVVADLESLPLRSGCAAAVINTQVLEHVREPGLVLKEIHRILEPGGELFLTVPQGWHEHQQPYDFFRFTSFALDRLLDKAGFAGWTIQPMGGYFHYLGHRLSHVPKVVFWQRHGMTRVLLLPVELLCLFFCCFLGPLLCYYLDGLDRDKEFTLCYSCLATR